MLRLYQFAISHFCEKARWALDYKGLEHERVNLLPGPHLLKMKRLAPKSSTPLLDDDGTLIQGSAEIVSHLDDRFLERSLTPEDPNLAREALEWESFLDAEVGVHVRRICYHTLLEHPVIVVPFFTHGGPWYGPLLYKVIFPRLRKVMRQAMDIRDETVAVSRQRLDAAVNRLAAALDGRESLVGDRFTRADLAAAALLAPLFRPAKYGLPWPERFPPAVEALAQDCAAMAPWVGRMYAAHR